MLVNCLSTTCKLLAVRYMVVENCRAQTQQKSTKTSTSLVASPLFDHIKPDMIV